ncbi:helix-turn-helix domain-containing protein [Streptosporangiaceae bacterium NEAU-GS5]|nr:helix-turn-helix domain-containing protein [Streptosporangiaceae bacterium NEAU-GS5]
MDTSRLLDDVRTLRGQGQSPKQIARALGVAPSVVAPLIRAIAAETRSDGELGEVMGCWINSGWSFGLTVDPASGWTDETAEEDITTGGLVSVVVARKHGWDKLSICGYLVDVYCLGVKNAYGPELGDERDLRKLREESFASYETGYVPAPVELARHVIFGAVDYASGLGFEPHPDFAEAVAHLGEWDGGSAITFGKDGKPFYVPGPYDNPRAVIKTLEKTVGPPPNFDYVLTGPEETNG